MFKKDDDNSEEIDLKKKVEEAEKEATENTETENASEIENTSEIEKIKEELEKMTELAKRTMADMQNMKRRAEEERTVIFSIAQADFVSKILPVIDNFDRALEHMPKEAAEWGKGIEMSISQLHKILTESGLTKIETVEKPFDPNLHEALMQGPGENNIITEELECGYMISDRIIRHAKVKVGNGEKE